MRLALGRSPLEGAPNVNTNISPPNFFLYITSKNGIANLCHPHIELKKNLCHIFLDKKSVIWPLPYRILKYFITIPKIHVGNMSCDLFIGCVLVVCVQADCKGG